MYGEHNKRTTLKKMREDVLFQNNEIIITKEFNGELTFQIGKEFTSDILEAVAILMRNSRWSNLDIWDLEIDIEKSNLNTINCLYWLSGADTFWNHPDCKVEWKVAYPMLVDEFDDKLQGISKKRKSLKEIRKSFIKHFNLDTFYEFALSKGII
jgi:hypothetical protein